MRVPLAIVALVLVSGGAASAGKLEVAYTSMERVIVKTFLTEGGRRYLQGSPGEDCAYAFIQEPRVSAAGGRLQMTFLFAGRAGTQVAGRCVGAGDNFDITVSGVPRYADGEFYLEATRFESEHTLYEVFAPLIESQLTPLLRIRARQHVESYVAELTARGAGIVQLESMDIPSIELGPSSAAIDAEFLITVRP